MVYGAELQGKDQQAVCQDTSQAGPSGTTGSFAPLSMAKNPNELWPISFLLMQKPSEREQEWLAVPGDPPRAKSPAIKRVHVFCQAWQGVPSQLCKTHNSKIKATCALSGWVFPQEIINSMSTSSVLVLMFVSFLLLWLMLQQLF